MAGKAKAEEPVFDFGRVPRGWTRRWAESLQTVSHHQADLAMVEIELQDMLGVEQTADTQRQLAQLQRRQADGLAAIRECSRQQERMVCEVLVSVPAAWVHPSAPQPLDWTQPESLDWLVDDHAYRDLLRAVQTARSAKN